MEQEFKDSPLDTYYTCIYCKSPYIWFDIDVYEDIYSLEPPPGEFSMSCVHCEDCGLEYGAEKYDILEIKDTYPIFEKKGVLASWKSKRKRKHVQRS